ncbi:MAG: preprotein translocase subunit SecY [Defluviitaleaceae bacterium]|nr:preprotein translocase subunit SecY [Defluviitaleaceae bacterium]
MFGVYSNALKVKDIRRKLFYILLVLLIFRVGSQIPLPGIDRDLLTEFMFGGGDGIIGLILGGEMGTIFAMGIGPYITASIIMQLLTVAIPKLEQLKKEGEEGRKKINQYTRILAVAMAIMQAAGSVFSWRVAFIHNNIFVYVVAALTMIAGTMFIMWMSELLTEKAIGNGASFIIFANILAALPMGIMTMYYASIGGVWNAVIVVIVVILFVLMVGFAVLVQDGQRKIPVQYSKKMVGRQTYGGQSSFIPVKVNIAGVMSLIFAMSILGFPQQIAMFFPQPEAGADPSWLLRVVEFLNMTTWYPVGPYDNPWFTFPFGAIIYVFLIFCFTFFYTSFAVNPVEMAENLKKNGGFIPGIRPGKPTSDYISRTVNRLSWVGAVFYAVIALIPILIEWFFGMAVGWGGTTLLIVVGVALELVKQLESQLLMRNYKGFLNT